MRSSTRWIVTVVLITVLGSAAPGMSQDAEFTNVDNPYQGEVAFSLGEPSEPMVDIAGVRWLSVRLVPSSPELVSGREVKTSVELTLENSTGSRAKVLVVILFEDASGNGLDRVELKPVAVPKGRRKTFRQKVKIQADVLKAAVKLYLFAEVR